MIEQIKETLSEFNNEIICSFIIGSFVYSKKFNDIDIVAISKNLFCQKIRIFENTEIKITFLPETKLKEDLKSDKYGSFIYGRFLNPIYVIKNEKIIYEYQSKSIKRELMYTKELIKENNNELNILKNFILSRGLYFPKYLKNLDNITILENENIKSFCNCIIQNYNNKCATQKLVRDCENIFAYWDTRFLSKNKPMDINEIIGPYNFKLNINNIIKGG